MLLVSIQKKPVISHNDRIYSGEMSCTFSWCSLPQIWLNHPKSNWPCRWIFGDCRALASWMRKSLTTKNRCCRPSSRMRSGTLQPVNDCGKLCNFFCSCMFSFTQNSLHVWRILSFHYFRPLSLYTLVCILQLERCAQLRAQLIESEEKSQWMTNYVEDIKMQLCQTQQGNMPVHHVAVLLLTPNYVGKW